jgi:hypothetical protein
MAEFTWRPNVEVPAFGQPYSFTAGSVLKVG